MTTIIGGSTGVTTQGLYSDSTFAGTYTDGVVLDYTTGLGRISVGTSDGLAFYNGGVANTERMRLDSSGNLGLGVTPSAWISSVKALEVSAGFLGNTSTTVNFGLNAYVNSSGTWTYKNTAVASYYEQYGGGHAWYRAGSGTAGNPIAWIQAMTLDASGNLGLGSTAPSSDGASGYKNLVIGTSSGSAAGITMLTNNSGATTQGIIWARSAAAVNGFVKYDHYYDALTFGTAAAERARIDSNGSLLVGTTDNSYTTGNGLKYRNDATGRNLILNSSSSSNANEGFMMYSTGAGAYRFYVQWDGKINATSTTIAAISDERLKENIRDLDLGLTDILALKPRRYDWKEGKGPNIKDAVGFIAQEFETVFPTSVGISKAGEDGIEYKNICHEELIPTLVKAIQEQQAIIEALRADVEQLKGQA